MLGYLNSAFISANQIASPYNYGFVNSQYGQPQALMLYPGQPGQPDPQNSVKTTEEKPVKKADYVSYEEIFVGLQKGNLEPGDLKSFLFVEKKKETLKSVSNYFSTVKFLFPILTAMLATIVLFKCAEDKRGTQVALFVALNIFTMIITNKCLSLLCESALSAVANEKVDSLFGSGFSVFLRIFFSFLLLLLCLVGAIGYAAGVFAEVKIQNLGLRRITA